MIHSLSGGVLSENGRHTFVKVELGGAPYWFLSPCPVKTGDRVLVPFGKGDFPTEAVAVKVEEATAQCSPVPMKHLKELYRVL